MDKKKEETIQNKVIETYALDMAQVLRDDKEGLIRKVIRGEERRELENSNFSGGDKKNKILVLLGMFFLLCTLVVMFFVFFKRKDVLISTETLVTPFIFNDKSVFLEIKDLKTDEIIQSILNEINNTDLKIGGVESIYLSLDKKTVGLRDFMKLIKSDFVFPQDFFINDNFLMGFVNNAKDASVVSDRDYFILIKMRSVPDIFMPLRSWENKILNNLHNLFALNLSNMNNYLLTKDFEDGIVDNKNARILFDKNRNIVLMYIFVDDNFVLITKTLNTANEIITRLSSSKIGK